MNPHAIQSQCCPSKAYQQGEQATNSSAGPETNNAKNSKMDEEEGDERVYASEDLAVELEETQDPSVEHFLCPAIRWSSISNRRWVSSTPMVVRGLRHALPCPANTVAMSQQQDTRRSLGFHQVVDVDVETVHQCCIAEESSTY